MKKIFFLFIFFAFLFLISAFIWWSDFLLPVNINDKKTKIFVIQSGESIDSISRKLYRQGLIKSTFGFKLLLSLLGINKNIQAGDFRLSSSMGAKEIAWELTHGTLDIWVTIPEGLRVEEIAEIINSKFLIPKSEFINEAKKYEGYLFPDTYLIPKKADEKMIIEIMKNNFKRRVGELINLEKAEKENQKFNGLSLQEVITLASIVEREGKYEDDRPKVASVLLNRLKIGMKLDVDATVQYVIGEKKCQLEEKDCKWWPEELTQDDLKVESLYNTYLYSGLPPTPICNPGLVAIQAVLTPAETDYLYYLSDAKGKMHFARTFEDHRENIIKYLGD